MQQLKYPTSLPALIAGVLALTPGLAGASGFALLEQSASRLGTAFAGTGAAADDATTIYFNPAGMMRLKGPEAIALASAIEITSEFSNRNTTPAFGQPLGGNGGDAGAWNFVPVAYLAVPLCKEFAVGIGVNVPFGLKLEYDRGWAGRFQALRSEITTANFNPALAYRVNDWLSLGAGVSYQRLLAELTNAVNYSAVVAQGVQQLVAAGRLPATAAPGIVAANAGLQGFTRIRGDDGAWGYNFGVLFELSPRTRFSLSYRSKVDYEVDGSISFEPPAAAEPIGAGIIASVSSPDGPLSSGPVTVDIEVPDSAIFSLQQQLTERVNLLADVHWTGWSSVPELRVVRDSGATVSVTPEQWEDVWRYALGASVALNERVTVRFGAAYDETPVPDATRTPRLPDPDRTWAAIGVRWEPNHAAVLDVGYAHLFSDDVPLDNDAGNAAAAGRLTGEQSGDIDILSAQLIFRF